MFIVGEIVRPSGKGRTATWVTIAGTVTRVNERSVCVLWHNIAVERDMLIDEIVSTYTFVTNIPYRARVLDGSEDGKLLLTFYDDEKNSS